MSSYSELHFLRVLMSKYTSRRLTIYDIGLDPAENLAAAIYSCDNSGYTLLQVRLMLSLVNDLC